MSYGSEFQAVRPVTENACSPSLVLVGGTVYARLFVDERGPCRRDEAAVFWTLLLTLAADPIGSGGPRPAHFFG